MQFVEDTEVLDTKGVNHYLASKFYFFVGTDRLAKWSYNGRMAYVRINLGEGSFRVGKDFSQKDDIFAITYGD